MIYEFLKYLITSKKRKSKIKSVFLSKFAIKVLNDFKNNNNFIEIEEKRKKLLCNHQTIKVIDLGAGSKKKSSNLKKVSTIAKNSLTSAKYCRMLYRLVCFTKSQNILELGTSFGVATLYFAECKSIKKIITVEGDVNISHIANENFSNYEGKIELINSDFDSFLHNLNPEKKFDIIFIDGNHKKEATIKYFNFLKEFLNDKAVVIFDDIRWSRDMLAAWNEISKPNSDYFTVDVFKMGFAFFGYDVENRKNWVLYY